MIATKHYIRIALEVTKNVTQRNSEGKKMRYIASVKDRETKELMLIERDYPTKKAFMSDLHGNGYAVKFISKEEEFDDDCAKYYEKKQIKNAVSRAIYASRKKSADRRGMSVKEYMEWLND